MIRVGRPRSAFTLVEALVAIAIISTLLGLLAVSITRVREAANRTRCQAHLKDLTIAVYHHHTAKGTMPPYASGRAKELYGGWYMHLLPYDGQIELYDYISSNQSVRHRSGVRVTTTGQYLDQVKLAVFPNLVCSSDPSRKAPGGDNLTNYVANWYALSDGKRGTYRKAQRFDSLRNGLSNVVLFAEAYSDCEKVQRLALYSAHNHNFGITQEGLPSDDRWYRPKDYLMFQVSPKKCDNWRSQTPHNVMHVALADGGIKGVSPTISKDVWKKLLKARDNSNPGIEW